MPSDSQGSEIDFAFQIGLTAYLDLFKRSPEAQTLFPFLKHLSQEDLEFYSQLKHHAIRVTGIITMLIKQVSKKVLHSLREK